MQEVADVSNLLRLLNQGEEETGGRDRVSKLSNTRQRDASH